MHENHENAMGQAQRNKQFRSSVLTALEAVGTPGSSTSSVSSSRAAAVGVLAGGFLPSLLRGDEPAHRVYSEALLHPRAEVQDGLRLLMNEFLAVGWTEDGLAGPAMTVALACELLPEGVDVIADLADTAALEQFVLAAAGLGASKVVVKPSLHDFIGYDGSDALLSTLAYAKHSMPERHCFRFGDGAAATPVVRAMLASLCFDTPQALERAYSRLQEGCLDLEASPTEATYTLRAVGSETTVSARAVVSPFVLGLPFDVLTDCLFLEGERALSQRLAAFKQAHSLEDTDLRLNIFVADQAPMALPDGVVSNGPAEAPDPQVAVLLGRTGCDQVGEVVLFYEGPHCLLAVPAALKVLAGRAFAEVLLGGTPC